jgi:ADP-ribosylglycohydrolase
VLGRGAASSGDSDSIACLAGAFAGAALGLGAWPASWQSRIEYADRIARLATAWDR